MNTDDDAVAKTGQIQTQDKSEKQLILLQTPDGQTGSDEEEEEAADSTPIRLLQGGKILTVEQSNQLARSNPQILANIIQSVYRNRVTKPGKLVDDNEAVAWGQCALPFYFIFAFAVNASSCFHLLSAKDRRALKPVSRLTQNQRTFLDLK